MERIEDRLALKELVDLFSNLADVKDIKAQVELFVENANVKSYNGNELVSDLTGRQALLNSFTNFLDLFDTVYHINGQQTLEFDCDNAKGTCYCQVVLIGEFDGKKTMSTQGVRYHDEYVKIENKWYIKNRVANFMWTDQKEI